MRKYFMLIVMFLLSVTARAENIVQFTGGNYVFAQTGSLIFNLNPQMFEDRNWSFDKASDSAVTQFTAALPLKTRHASDFHGYGISQLEAATNMRVVVTSDMGHAMLMRPVYRYGQHGRQVKVWLPAAAGWVIRIGGAIARNVLPPMVTRCLTNTNCKSFVGVLAAHTCVINWMWGEQGFLRKIGFPAGVCEQAEKDGFKKNPEGQYERKSNKPYYAQWRDLHSAYGREGSELIIAGGGQPAESLSAAKAILEAKCKGLVGRKYNSPWPMWGFAEEATIKSTNVSWAKHGNGEQFRCELKADLEEGDEDTLLLEGEVVHVGNNHKEVLTMVDLSNFVAKDFEKNPNTYINDKGQVGKEIREKIKPSASVVKKSGNSPSGTSGSFTTSSNIYTDPKTGSAVQDNVTISAVVKPSSPDVPPIAGSIGGSGNGSNRSTVINNVTVTTNPRPDRQNDAVAAQINPPNGTGLSNSGSSSDSGNSGSTSGSGSGSGSSGGSVISGSGIGNGSGSGTGNAAGNGTATGNDASGVGSGGLDCKDEHKDVLACAQMGSIDDGGNPFELPTTQVDTGFAADTFMDAPGLCPVPKQVSIMGKQYLISYDWVCRFAEQIRMIIIALAYLTAGYIIFSARKD